MMDRTDTTMDYDKEIDALFEGLSGAPGILSTGRMAGMGVALSDGVKERLVARHGEAADFLVYNTGRYENGIAGSWLEGAPSSPPMPTGMERLMQVFGRVLGRREPKATPPPSMPRWMTLIRDRKAETERVHVMREKILGRHGRQVH